MAAITIGTVCEHAAAPKTSTHQFRIGRIVYQVAWSRDLRTCHTRRQIAALVWGCSVKLQGLKRKVLEICHRSFIRSPKGVASIGCQSAKPVIQGRLPLSIARQIGCVAFHKHPAMPSGVYFAGNQYIPHRGPDKSIPTRPMPIWKHPCGGQTWIPQKRPVQC